MEDKALLNTMVDTLTKTKAETLNDKPGDVEALTDYLSGAQARVEAKTLGVEAEALINTRVNTQAKAYTLGDILDDEEANVLLNALADKLTWDQTGTLPDTMNEVRAGNLSTGCLTG